MDVHVLFHKGQYFTFPVFHPVVGGENISLLFLSASGCYKPGLLNNATAENIW
jgi:hypothetical protein